MSMKDVYCDKIKTDLQAWQARLEQLDAEARRDIDRTLEGVRSKSQAVAATLDALGHPGDKDWEDRKGQLEAALDAFRASVVAVASRVGRAA